MSDFIVHSIDIPTLAFSRGLMQIVIGGLLLYLGGQAQSAPGARHWAIGFFLNGLSLFVFPIQVPAAWEIPRNAINHMALGFSSAFFLAGFWAFGNQPPRRWLLVLLVALPAASLLAWELAWPNARYRILTTASSQAIYLFALQYSLQFARRPELTVICQRLRYVVMAYLMLVIWAYGSIADVLPTTARVGMDYHRLLFSGGSLLFMLSLAVGCLALQFGLLAARNADLARTDWLTGLLNRRGFFQAVADAPAPAGSVIAVDIDHFKDLNDRHGHATGDRVLQALAEQLRVLVQPPGLVARIGGEEFCILLPAIELARAQTLAEALVQRCRDQRLHSAAGQPITFTISAGVAPIEPTDDIERALAQADAALYRAKAAGRDQVRTAA